MKELIRNRLEWLQDRIDNPNEQEEQYKRDLQAYLKETHPELYKLD